MAPDPNTPSKIPAPSSLLDSESSSLPPNTRNALLSYLHDSTTIPRLNHLLTDSLARAGWTSKVHEAALELLRSGECANFSEVLGEISRRAGQGLSSNGKESNGHGEDSHGISLDIKIPQEVVEKSVRFLKDEIDTVIEVVQDEKNGVSNGVNGHRAK